MDWQTIIANVVDQARANVMLFAGLSYLIVLVALLNWTNGGIAAFGRPLMMRQSWPFVTMRWLGLLMWAGSLSVSFPRNPQDPHQLFGAAVHAVGAVVMLVGTARKPLRERFIETPSSVKSLFGDPSEQQSDGNS